jgi:hypothetical protein
MSTWKMVLARACIRRKGAGADCTSGGRDDINFTPDDVPRIAPFAATGGPAAFVETQ